MASEGTEDLAKIAEKAPPIIEVVVAPVILMRLSTNHRKAVTLSHTCGCYYCLDTYSGIKVKEWVDKGCTALCPHCGIDSVLPSHWVKITPALLKHLHEIYFENYTKLGECPEREDLRDGYTGDFK